MEGQTNSSFVSMLFDFSFTEFITTKLIKVLYMIGILLVGLWCLALLLSSFTQGAGAGVLALLSLRLHSSSASPSCACSSSS